MRVIWIVPFVLAVFSISQSSIAQQTQGPASPAQRDPQGLNLLTQTLSAAGGVSAITAIQDFTGTGNITYYWSGKEVPGPATVRGRGVNEFRLDATLPDGMQSWAVASWKGSLKSTSGKISQIPAYNAINLGSLTLPFVEMANALRDSSVSVSLVDQEQINGRSAYRIRVQRTFGAAVDPRGTMSGWTTKDYLIDATTLLPAEIHLMTHPVETHLRSYLQEIVFTDYRSVNGVVLPFSITEKIGGQTTWMIQLSSISFNTGLKDSDFQL
jgi:hypothetical protein